MALQIQYDFFEETDDVSMLKKEQNALALHVDKVRKGLFARHNTLNSSLNELLRLYLELKAEMDLLKRNL